MGNTAAKPFRWFEATWLRRDLSAGREMAPTPALDYRARTDIAAATRAASLSDGARLKQLAI